MDPLKGIVTEYYSHLVRPPSANDPEQRIQAPAIWALKVRELDNGQPSARGAGFS